MKPWTPSQLHDLLKDLTDATDFIAFREETVTRCCGTKEYTHNPGCPIARARLAMAWLKKAKVTIIEVKGKDSSGKTEVELSFDSGFEMGVASCKAEETPDA